MTSEASEEEAKLQAELDTLRAFLGKSNLGRIDPEARTSLMDKLKGWASKRWMRSFIRIAGVGAWSLVVGMIGRGFFTNLLRHGIGGDAGAVPIVVAIVGAPLFFYFMAARNASKLTDHRMAMLRKYAPAQPRSGEVDLPHEPMSYRRSDEAPATRIRRLRAEIEATNKALEEANVDQREDKRLKHMLRASDAQGVLRSLRIPVWFWPLLFMAIGAYAEGLTLSSRSGFAMPFGIIMLIWTADAVLRRASSRRVDAIEAAITEVSGAPKTSLYPGLLPPQLELEAPRVRVAPSAEDGSVDEEHGDEVKEAFEEEGRDPEIEAPLR